MTDQSAGIVQALRSHGTALWPEFVPIENATRLRMSAQALLAGKAASHYARSTRVWRLYRHGPEFVRLMSDERLLAVTSAVLGDDPLISDFSLNAVSRGGTSDAWHIDYPFNEMQTIVSGAPLGMQCILALSAFTEENGATQFIPDSFTRYSEPEPEPIDGAATFVASPGDLLLMTASTWHRAGLNLTATPRVAVLYSFVERWIRPMEEHSHGPWSHDNETVRRLLGLSRPPQTMPLDGGVAT